MKREYVYCESCNSKENCSILEKNFYKINDFVLKNVYLIGISLFFLLAFLVLVKLLFIFSLFPLLLSLFLSFFIFKKWINF